MGEKKANAGVRLLAENRRAYARYSFEEKLEVGIVLLGSEVKSIRTGQIELNDAFAQIQNGEMFLLNMHVAAWNFARTFCHETKRVRKLLAHREEIDKLDGKIRIRGYTLIPLRVYLKEGRVKIELGLGKGKAQEDRREELRARDSDREARQEIARARRG